MNNPDFLSSSPEYGFKPAEAAGAGPQAPPHRPCAPGPAPGLCSQHTHLKHVLRTPRLCLWRTESTWTAPLGLLHNCGWRYFSLGSLNKDSRDKFLLEFSSRKCLVSADVYMLPVVSTWKRYGSVLLFLTWASRKSQIKNMIQTSLALTNGST